MPTPNARGFALQWNIGLRALKRSQSTYRHHHKNLYHAIYSETINIHGEDIHIGPRHPRGGIEPLILEASSLVSC